MCTPIFTEVLFIIAKTWKQLKCPSMNEWIKIMWYTHTTDYYSAIKMKEILPFVTTGMDLKDIVLSEISQKEKDKYCMMSLISKKTEFIDTENSGGWQKKAGMRMGGKG